jgi:multiple sugar transport system permease protein
MSTASAAAGHPRPAAAEAAEAVRRGPSPWRKIAAFGLTALAVAVVSVPLLWMAFTSLKTNKEITQDGTILPSSPTLDNYQRLFNEIDFGSYLRNSIGITALSVLFSLVIGSLAAYSIARFRLRWKLEQRLGISLLTARMIPPIVMAIPIYLLILKLGLINSWLGLILVYTGFNVTFVVWMMESFFREIPVDLEEAAMVDGDTRMSAFRRIVLPLAGPGLVATAIFAIIVTFNEFLMALVLTSTPDAMTVPRGTATLIGRIDIDWGAMSAAGVVAALPIVIFALFVQRHLVRGLTLGAVK